MKKALIDKYKECKRNGKQSDNVQKKSVIPLSNTSKMFVFPFLRRPRSSLMTCHKLFYVALQQLEMEEEAAQSFKISLQASLHKKLLLILKSRTRTSGRQPPTRLFQAT